MANGNAIYLDNNATTRIDPAVVEEMLPFLTESYANPSSGYRCASNVREALDLARDRVAALLGCDASEIVFTSCGTESNNAALNAAIQFDPRGKHVITSAVEHSAVLRHCQELARRGCEVTFLGVDCDGNVDLAELEAALRPNTAVVSLMWANNETGVLFPVEKVAQLCRRNRVLFHTDAVQAAGKIPIALRETAISYLSISAHKFHGPKGVGALYINRNARFRPSIIGGSQENGRRAGTENVASIVAMGKAAQLAVQNLAQEETRVRGMRDRFEKAIVEGIEGISINGGGASRLPNTSNLSFDGIESHAALMLLDRQCLCCSAGSACKTGSNEGSHVLRAMHSEDCAHRSLRFSFGRFNTDADVDQGLDIVSKVVAKLRSLSAPVRQAAVAL